MLEAAKFGDPVIGVDIHMVLVPAPPAPPIPTPLPHPFVGVVFDPLGAAIGAALGLAFGGGGPVLINSMPCGNTGTEVKGVPHFPTPPGVSFAPNDIPSNDGTLIFGSKTVTMAGSSIARLTDLVMTCNFPINLPTSVCMAVPMGAPVLVGGPPSMDWFAAITKAIRTKWFSDMLHKVTGGRFSKVICFLTGHPVDVMTGEVLTDRADFELPGPLPLIFERNYCSRSTYDGPLGPGWSHSLDQSVHEEDWRLVVRLADGRERYHPRIPEGVSLWDDADRYTLERTAWGYTLTTSEGLTCAFTRVEGARATHPLVRVSDRSDNAVRLRYERGALCEVTDSAGRTLRFDRRADGRLARVCVQRPAERGARWMELVRYEYDDAGALAAAFDAGGDPYRYEYRGGVLVRETDRNGMSFYFEYDREHPDGWCTRTWGDGGAFDRRITYDKHRHVTLVDDSLGGRTHYFGNAAGLVTQKIDPTGGVWKYEWDARYRKVAEEDPLGHRTEWGYDARGNRELERDALGHETRWRYDARGGLVGVTDAAGHAWELGYDDRGRLTRRTDPLGRSYEYDHDARGQRVGVIDPLGRRAHFGYNERGDLTEARDADGGVTRYETDDLGRLTRRVDPLGRETRLEWDDRGRIVALARTDGTELRVEYDGEGNPTRITDARGRVRRFRYGVAGRLVEREDPGGSALKFQYDAEGRLVGAVNERGDRYSMTYDLAGRLVRERSFGGREVEYRYDRAGRCVAVVEGDGKVTRIERDALGQRVAQRFADGTERRYEYDPRRQLVAALTADAEVFFDRDPLGRVVRERRGDVTVEGDYDVSGDRVRRATSLGHAARYRYDGRGRLRGVWIEPSAGEASWELSIARDAAGHETAREVAGASARWLRDAAGRPVERELKARGDVLADGYQWRGRELAARIDPARGMTRFEYDVRGRLVASHDAAGASVWRAPDVVGGLFRDPTREARAYTEDGALTRDRGARRIYDRRGRLVEKVGADGSRWRYAWDGADQLRSVTRADGSVVAFAYDALGRRVRKSAGAAATEYVWDGDTLVHEVSGGAVTSWVFDPEEGAPLAKVDGAKRYGVFVDHLGTPAALVDEVGALAWSAQLDIYGAARADVARTGCPWRWPGQYEDEETGLYYNRFRYYDPEAGGYISPDPIGLRGGANLHAYPHDPLTRADPLGLVDPFDVMFSQDSVSHEFQHGPWKGRCLDEAVAEARRLGRLPDGLELRVMRLNDEWVTLSNRTLLVAQEAGLRNVPVTDVGHKGVNQLNKLLDGRPPQWEQPTVGGCKK